VPQFAQTTFAEVEHAIVLFFPAPQVEHALHEALPPSSCHVEPDEQDEHAALPVVPDAQPAGQSAHAPSPN